MKFRGIFKKQSNHQLSTDNVGDKLKIADFYFLFKYREHYLDFLVDTNNQDRVISELFVFRAWTTQFGYRLFTSDHEISEKIIDLTFNLGQMGIGMLKLMDSVDLENEFSNDYQTIFDERWQQYDKLFIDYRDTEPPIPTWRICGGLMKFCNISDPIKYTWICEDFLKQLNEIKNEAINKGLFK